MPNYELYKATDVNRYYQDMNEHLVAGGIDYKGLLVDKGLKLELLAGAAAQYKSRAFDGRKFLYTSGYPSTLPSDFLYGDLTEIFQPENLRADGYFIDGLTAGRDCMVEIALRNGGRVRLVTLTEDESDRLWRGRIGGKDFLCLTSSALTYDDEGVTLIDERPEVSADFYADGKFARQTRSAAPPSCLAVYRPNGMETASMIKKAISVRVRVMA